MPSKIVIAIFFVSLSYLALEAAVGLQSSVEYNLLEELKVVYRGRWLAYKLSHIRRFSTSTINPFQVWEAMGGGRDRTLGEMMPFFGTLTRYIRLCQRSGYLSRFLPGGATYQLYCSSFIMVPLAILALWAAADVVIKYRQEQQQQLHQEKEVETQEQQEMVVAHEKLQHQQQQQQQQKAVYQQRQNTAAGGCRLPAGVSAAALYRQETSTPLLNDSSRPRTETGYGSYSPGASSPDGVPDGVQQTPSEGDGESDELTVSESNPEKLICSIIPYLDSPDPSKAIRFSIPSSSDQYNEYRNLLYNIVSDLIPADIPTADKASVMDGILRCPHVKLFVPFSTFSYLEELLGTLLDLGLQFEPNEITCEMHIRNETAIFFAAPSDPNLIKLNEIDFQLPTASKFLLRYCFVTSFVMLEELHGTVIDRSLLDGREFDNIKLTFFTKKEFLCVIGAYGGGRGSALTYDGLKVHDSDADDSRGSTLTYDSLRIPASDADDSRGSTLTYDGLKVPVTNADDSRGSALTYDSLKMATSELRKDIWAIFYMVLRVGPWVISKLILRETTDKLCFEVSLHMTHQEQTRAATCVMLFNITPMTTEGRDIGWLKDHVSIPSLRTHLDHNFKDSLEASESLTPNEVSVRVANAMNAFFHEILRRSSSHPGGIASSRGNLPGYTED